jgi:MEMO1 family protein
MLQSSQSNYKMDIRPSPIAGTWYPSNPKRLADTVEAYIQSSKIPPVEGQVIAVIAPHAGHIYSGPVAGHAFAALRGLTPDLVAVISPMHYPYNQPLISTAHEEYSTPLGNIPVDQNILAELSKRLKNSLGIDIYLAPQDPEHSLEIELPFLQSVLPAGFKLLPIMVREQSERLMQELGCLLAECIRDQNAILVASTDLSHFYPQEIARKLDTFMLDQIAAFNPSGVLQAEDEGRGFACGRGAVAAVLWAARWLGADQVTILNYATSGDVSGDYRQVVGYGAAVVTRRVSG